MEASRFSSPSSLSLSLFVLTFESPFPPSGTEEAARLIKSLLRKGKGEEAGGEIKGEGVAKSILQVNLSLEIIYTINKQGESGGEGRGLAEHGGAVTGQS